MREGLTCMWLFAITALVPLSAPLGAREYGVLGTTWGIAEPDLLASIRTKLEALKANGGIARMQTALVDQAKARVHNPVPVAGIGPTKAPKSWLFDPSINVAHDIRDQKGNLVAAAGTHVNPLDFVQMRQDLVFVDGASADQVAWALGRWRDGQAKIVFVAGSPFESMKAKKRRFFFDQKGALTKHFGIEHVPAVVHATGKALEVSEIVVPGDRS